MKLRHHLYRLVFPNGVRIVHFLLVPAVGMAILLGTARVLDGFILPGLTPGEVEIYRAIRTAAVAVLMSSLIAFLAFSYPSGYEAKLQARNEDLEATRDFLSRIISRSAEAIITRDESGRVTSWNPAAETIYGWSAMEMTGQPIDRLLPPEAEAQPAFDEIEHRLARGETVRGFEATRVRKDGRQITVQLTLSPMHDRVGTRVGTTGIVRDVTVLKEMERMLLEKERLAAVGELAAVVAHEVRNPLAGIRGGCEILLEGYAEGDPRTEIGREVLRQVDRLNGTVHELLLFARPKAMDPVPTDLHALLDMTMGVLREDPSNSNVVTRRDYAADLPAVSVDPRQMEQVFLNLILNAAQAMHHKGTITISTRRAGEGVELVVGDSGPGIPEGRMEDVFKPFYTTRSQGTGLGLAIVKKIVEAHGGRIEAGSAREGGARFTMFLPAARPRTA